MRQSVRHLPIQALPIERYGYACIVASYEALLIAGKNQKMLKDVGMAVPKITETTCRDGSVQAKLIIQSLQK